MKTVISVLLLLIFASACFAGDIIINDKNKNEVIGTWTGFRSGSSSTTMSGNMVGKSQQMETTLIFTAIDKGKYIGKAVLENKSMKGKHALSTEFNITASINDKGCLTVERDRGVWTTLCMSEEGNKKYLKGTYKLSWEGPIELEKQK